MRFRGIIEMIAGVWLVLHLGGCRTGEKLDASDANGESGGSGLDVPTLELSLSPVKQFEFSWDPVVGADYYQLLESVDTGAPYVQVGPEVMGLATALTVPLHLRLNASYKLNACKTGEECTESVAVETVGTLVEAIGYFKASNTDEEDQFGIGLALSDDGRTLAVGAPTEDSGATGIGGDQADNSATSAGAVYVFERNEQGMWSQQAYLKASNTGWYDEFGVALALSGDGSTLVVGAPGEESNATGIDGNQADNSATSAGAVYVFERDEQGVWSQQAYVKASNTDADDWFGVCVALSRDGSTLAVAATHESSNATGIGGNQADDSADDTGAVYVYATDGQGVWSQQAYVKASNTDVGDLFGGSVELSEDGNTLAIGASGEASNATGIGGNQADNSAPYAGAVYVFERGGQGVWSQKGYVKASNTNAGHLFGSVGLSGDGSTMAVGAYGEDSNGPYTGAVYVFERDGQGGWSQQAYLEASNTNQNDEFGISVGLSGDASTLAVGASQEGSNAMGIGSDQANEATPVSGAVYVFKLNEQGVWSQQAYVKASNTSVGALFGSRVELDVDGSTLVVGAHQEGSNATGIGGNQADDSASQAGAVYVY